MIRFHFSNFAQAKTAIKEEYLKSIELWFAFILVILRKRKQLYPTSSASQYVVIRFHFSNFAQAKTANCLYDAYIHLLWFAFILVILRKRKQHRQSDHYSAAVVIRFHFSNFAQAKTAYYVNK